MAKASPNKSKKSRIKDPVTPGKPPISVAASATASTPRPEDEIRQRAYEIYEEEGRQEGRDQEYWLRAEAEVLGRRGARSA